MRASKGISAFCVTLSLLLTISLFVINPLVIEKLFGELHLYYVENIYGAQISIGALALFLILLGLLGYKKNIFKVVERKEYLGNILLGFIFFSTSILYVEFILRIKPELTTQELYDASIPYENSMFARSRLPQKSTQIYYPYIDNKLSHNINQGYHGNEFSYKKPKDEIRVVVLGGSFVFGDQSPISWGNIENEYNSNWVLKSEKKLHKKGYKNIRIINAGIPGHTSFDSFGRLYSEIHLFNPDYILFCHGWNDIEYFSEVTPANSLFRQMNFPKVQTREEVSDALEISQIYLRIKRRFQFDGLGVEGIKHKPQKGLKISTYSVKQFNLNLDLFVHTCKLIGAKPILLTQPRLINKENTAKQREKILYSFQRLNHDGICEAYTIIDSIIINYHQKDTNVISHHFAKEFIGVDSLYVDHLHLNSKGNEVISSSLASFLEEVIIKK
jgi:lysophospholipase L1-like esterase